MITLHESMVPSQDRTYDPSICRQTRYQLRYGAPFSLNYPESTVSLPLQLLQYHSSPAGMYHVHKKSLIHNRSQHCLSCYIECTVNVLKFWSLVACQKGQDKQDIIRSDCFWRRSLIKFFLVCYFANTLWIPALIIIIFFWEQKEVMLKILEHFL